MKKGKKMEPCLILKVIFAVLFINNAQGYSSLPPLKNYNLNATSETTHIKRILAFGDSLTEGFLSGGRKFYPYTTKLEEKLNAYFNWTRFEVLNEGISGECVFTEMVTRLPKILGRVGHRIDLVIILGGTNDFHKLDCLKRINVAHEVITLHKIVHKTGIKSVLVTIPECSSLGKKCDKARLRVNEKLRGYAMLHKNNTLLCDLGKYMPLHNMSSFDRKIYWDDDVHPSKIGYDKIAALLFHTIREWLIPPTLSTVLPDGKENKTVPDPDPISKIRKHKSNSQKSKQRYDKKLAQNLVSETNPASTNTTKLPSKSATNTFSSSSTPSISALPSISSSTSSSTASNSILPSTNPTISNNNSKPLKSTNKHKAPSHKNKHHTHKKISNAVVSQVTSGSTVSPNKELSSDSATTTFSAPNAGSSNASPPLSTLSSTSTASNSALPSTNTAYTPTSSNTSSTYNQYYSTNGTYNTTPNGTLPIEDTSDAGDIINQFPDYTAYTNTPSSNYTQQAPSNTTNPANGYTSNSTNTNNPNVTMSNMGTNNDVGDLARDFPEYNLGQP